MKIALITLFPEMFSSLTEYGISGRAVKNGLLECHSLTQETLLKTVTRQSTRAPTAADPAW